jgi:hypothetical protein
VALLSEMAATQNKRLPSISELFGDLVQPHAQQLQDFSATPISQLPYSLSSASIEDQSIFLNQSCKSLHIDGSTKLDLICKESLGIPVDEGDYDASVSKLDQLDKPKNFDTLSCPVCRVIFPNRFQLSVHLKNHVGTTLSCPICRLKFADQSQLSSHEKNHVGTWF